MPGEIDPSVLDELLERTRGRRPTAQEIEECRESLTIGRSPFHDHPDRLSRTLQHVVTGDFPGLLVIGIGADGVSTCMIRKGRHGAPLQIDKSGGYRRWWQIGSGLPASGAICRFLLAGGVGDQPDRLREADRHVETLYSRLSENHDLASPQLAIALVLDRSGWPMLDEIARGLVKRRSPVCILIADDFDEAVTRIAARAPLREPYALILALDEPHSGETLVAHTLFPPGTEPGPDVQTSVLIRAPSGVGNGVSLPVVKLVGKDPAEWIPVSNGFMELGPGESAELWAVLDGVDRVRLVSHHTVKHESRPWPALLTSHRAWARRPKLVDLVFLVELNTKVEQVAADRRRLVDDVITRCGRAQLGPDGLRVGVVGYRDHGEKRLYDVRKPETYRLGDAHLARTRLGAWDSTHGHKVHPTTAALSDALHLATDLGWREDSDARFVIALGDRMPCDVNQFSKPVPERCTEGRSWRAELSLLKRKSVRCMAVVSGERKEPEDRSWESIGSDGHFDADTVTTDGLLHALGLDGEPPFACPDGA